MTRRGAPAVLGACALVVALAGCTTPTSGPPSAPPPAATASPGVPSPGVPSPGVPSPGGTPPGSPGATDSATPTTSPDADTLRAAFEDPRGEGIAGFLRRHPEYLPATITVAGEVASGAADGNVDLAITVPPGTTGLYLNIACASQVPYRMEALREGRSMGASWADSCGYWGGLHGYTTAPFDPQSPPTRLQITVAPGTNYSFAVFAVARR